jgi:hypothetical protein
VEWERSGAQVLQRMAIEEPSKFAQLAAGLIPREALLTVAQQLPGNLEGEDWELILSVCAAIKQALPDAKVALHIRVRAWRAITILDRWPG